MKRRGKPDPFAYVPLNKSSLNKRKRQKFEGQFSSIVKSAKKGAAQGRKNRGGGKGGGNVAASMRKMSI